MRKNEMNEKNLNMEAGCVTADNLDEVKNVVIVTVDDLRDAKKKWIIDNPMWEQKGKAKLIKADLTMVDIQNLMQFYETMDKYWESSLIVREFIKNKENMNNIIKIIDGLQEEGIIDSPMYFRCVTFSKLAQAIHTQADWEDFLELYEREIDNHILLKVIDMYLESKKFETKDDEVMYRKCS